jgi:hypothetical protein
VISVPSPGVEEQQDPQEERDADQEGELSGAEGTGLRGYPAGAAVVGDGLG